MQATIEIPEQIYRQLEHEAELGGKSLEQIIVGRLTEHESVAGSSGDALPFDVLVLGNGLKLPQIRSKRSVPLTETPNDLFDFDAAS